MKTPIQARNQVSRRSAQIWAARATPTIAGTMNATKIDPRTCWRNAQVRVQLEASCTMPCSGTTSGAGSSAVITPRSVTPPAMPKMPEIVAVTTSSAERAAEARRHCGPVSVYGGRIGKS